MQVRIKFNGKITNISETMSPLKCLWANEKMYPNRILSHGQSFLNHDYRKCYIWEKMKMEYER